MGCGVRSMNSVECIVAGAGLIGLALAHRLARSGREVVEVWSAGAICTVISSQ
jgi:glycine/D-amino acid oxidase-like deaminating enzyme